jgi:hypothetical protein
MVRKVSIVWVVRLEIGDASLPPPIIRLVADWESLSVIPRKKKSIN